jgi:F-type H+-transporting ATPase subunit delta
MMSTGKRARREAKQLFRACLVDGSLDEGRVRQVVQAVSRLKRRGYLSLLGHFQRLVKLEVSRHTAEVESALPLAGDLQASVRNGLERTYGSRISVLFAQEPALIGGMRIKVGSDVYDGSVRYRLSAIAKGF